MKSHSYEVFISYSSGEASFADALARKLTDSGVKVWFDKWNISPGDEWTKALKQGIAQSDAVAVCIGAAGENLDFKLVAESQQKDPSLLIVPILLEGAKPETLPAKLRSIQVSEQTSPDAIELMDRLAETLLAMGEFTAATNVLKARFSGSPKTGKGWFERFKSVFELNKDGGAGHKGVKSSSIETITTGDIPGGARQGGVSALSALAKQILRGQAAKPQELLRLAAGLKKEKGFGLARRLLERARLDPALRADSRLRLQIYQQLALCTYKDPDLPADARPDWALSLLSEVEDLGRTKNQETLGLLGAIHKSKWEVDEQRTNLERALFYYLRGYEEGARNDQGYNGINAAFILDLLAQQEEEEARKANAQAAIARARREKAREIRKRIVTEVAPLKDFPESRWLAGQWWFYSTVAEAFFGIGEYSDAVEWLEKGRQKAAPIAHWEYESTARQLATLARLQNVPDASIQELETSEAWNALARFFGDDVKGLRSAFVGKIGLALSGGGFRASLFHIGVLARLAELDVLRNVEVLSCVSGGSIVGAHYYLEIRKLLQSKPDNEITREDYIQIVKRLEKHFLAGVQRNIRMRVTAEWLTSLKLIFQPGYSRITRVGELYEREIFSRVNDGESDRPRWLNDLYIMPKGEADNFQAKYDNWRRMAKVPMLILNATTLNTGHNWQFTTSWMGEPPADADIDGNELLRRMYYFEAPLPYRKIRLGHAVAASACTPGLYEPLVLADLYPERVVRLVDGGVHDNQGVTGILAEDCTVLLVSDASGQMTALKDPSPAFFDVPLRSNNILMSRVREAEHRELTARRRASLARGLMFINMKKGLDVERVDWIGCEDPYNNFGRWKSLTVYGLPKDVQELLAAIRSDFDSFSDREAYALMLSGYRMTEYEFPLCVKGFATQPVAAPGWRFLEVEEYLKIDAPQDERRWTMRLLNVASRRAFKVWKLSKPLKFTTAITSSFIAALIVWAGFQWRDRLLTLFIGVAALIVLEFVVLLIMQTVAKLFNRGKSWAEIIIGVSLAHLGFILARIHLLFFNRLYLRLGRLRR